MAKASTSKRSVLDERFLKCGVCNERFWDNSKLIKHMESHSETEQLLCTICNKTFSAVQDLDKHYTLHIQLMQPYGCPACESRFVTQHQLMTHVENIHPELTIGEKSSPKEQQPSETSRRNSPRSSKPHLIIKQVPPVLEKSGKTVPPQPKKEKVKPSEQSSQESTAKKSILKVAPTPSGKKKPVIWKDPIVSPDKTLQGNVVSVKQSLAEKRKLVDAPVASSDAKKLKIVASATVGESAATPIRKTPVTKTKLMQSISKLYDKQTPSERKSLAQTRKDLLNALTITPVTKGPIRVLRTTKPFIVFSQSKDAADEVKRDIVHNSTTSSNVVQGKVKTAPGASQDFDKLLVSKTPPCVEKSDIKKVQQGLKVSSIQLISIKTPPGLTIQATSPGNSTIAKSEKSEKECAAASPARSTKLLQPIFPAGKLPQVIRIIPQNSPLLKPVPSSPVKTNVSPANSAQTVSVTLVKSPKSVVVAGKRPAKEVIESKPETPLISEKDVHRDSDEKYKKLQILLPKIQLRRFSGAELKNDTTENLPEADNNNTVEASDAKKVTKLLCHPRSCIKEQLSEKAGVVRGLKRRGKQQSTEDNSADKPSKMKCLPEKKVEVQSTSKLSNVNAEKLPFTERNSVQEQPKIENTKRPKTRGKLQLLEIKETKKLLPETSGIVDLPSVKVIPKSPTKNAASSKSEQPEDPAEKTENVVTRKSNRRGSQDLKSEVRDSVEVKKPAAPEATRRSKRTLAKKAIEETSPKGSKNAKKTIQRRKEVLKKTPVKKSILKKVIEKEVNAIESFEIRAEKAPENTTGASPAMSQTPNKIRVVTLTPEVMRKLKETVLKKTSSSTPNHIRLVVPPEVLCRIQNSATRGQNPGSPNSIAVTPTRSDPLSNLKVSVVPATTNVIRYGIEDLKRDQQKRREEKEKMAEKEKILKKMLVKFDEKEKKKQMKFWYVPKSYLFWLTQI